MTTEFPSSEDWSEWLQNPCTKMLREWACMQRDSLKEQWATGSFTASFEIETIARNAGATGACSVYVEVEELDFNQIIGVISDESKRT